MGITLTFNSFDEMVTFAKQLVGAPAKVEAKLDGEKVKEALKKPSESKTSMSTAPTGIEEEVPFEEKPAKTYTLEEVRAELAKLTRAGKQKEVKELLTSFGAKNLSSVDPKDYLALMEKAGAL
mgnify:CR=1 FL=1